jgi:methylmalonyl-CoA carboxyltransferase 5S subunit
MFPQVALKFISQRAEGPRNVGKDKPAAKGDISTARPPDGKGPVTSPVTYDIRIGNKSHKVTVEPAS